LACWPATGLSTALSTALSTGLAALQPAPLRAQPAATASPAAAKPALSTEQARAAAVRILEAIQSGDANARYAQFSDQLKAVSSPSMVAATMRSQPKVHQLPTAQRAQRHGHEHRGGRRSARPAATACCSS
jgi:sulfite reductase alpha subunit-like flavoprotein